jgi:hypothetical protein
MTLRVLVLAAVLGVACFVPHAGPGGLLERLPPAPDAVLVHVVVPSLLAIALAVLWPRLLWRRAALALVLGLLLGQVARMAVFAPHAHLQKSWGRLLTDSKDQFLLALSLVMQIGSGLLVLTVCKVVVRRAARRAAAAAAAEPQQAR